MNRLISIDAFRAIIMVLMIFVNDLWTLSDIPLWLGHVSAEADGMGLADMVFPAFLFIVGLSVPYAIQSRKKKGDSSINIFFHIISRTVALLVMGLFMVNYESYGEDALLSRQVWMLLLILAFFLIWMDYKTDKRTLIKVLRTIGMTILTVLVLTFGTDEESGLAAMQISWWGILGLIGWSYFIASSVTLFSQGNFAIVIVALLGLTIMNAFVPFIISPSSPALSLTGVLVAMTYSKWGSSSKLSWIILVVFAAVLISYGLVTRPLWGISKIRATPSWTTICSGIAILGFLGMVYITDVRKRTGWYRVIKPAGTSTLTCYLIPYVHYAIIGLVGIQLPLFMRTGTLGLIKSLAYALIIVFITGLMEKRNVRLKI